MVDRQEILKIAELAKLELSEDEIESLRGNFTQIKDFFGRLSEARLDASYEDENPDKLREVTRADEPRSSGIHIGDFTKHEEGNMFIVPKVIE